MSHVEDPAAQAVVRHHAQLSEGLNRRVEALTQLVDDDFSAGTPQAGGAATAENDQLKAEAARQDLLGWVRGEILPHAAAEEQALYPPAAALPEGKLLIAGMVEEHHALAALVAEVEGAGSPLRAATAARAISALFAVHLGKENDLVLPLLLTRPEVELTEVLAGMHELLGVEADHHHAGSDVEDPDVGDPEAAGGCGCGDCGCGGEQAAASSDAPVLSLDTRIDVRQIPHAHRHAVVLSTVAQLPPGEALVLIAPHAPRPVLGEVEARFGGQVQVQWLQSGPDVWQVRLERLAAPAA